MGENLANPRLIHETFYKSLGLLPTKRKRGIISTQKVSWPIITQDPDAMVWGKDLNQQLVWKRNNRRKKRKNMKPEKTKYRSINFLHINVNLSMCRPKKVTLKTLTLDIWRNVGFAQSKIKSLLLWIWLREIKGWWVRHFELGFGKPRAVFS